MEKFRKELINNRLCLLDEKHALRFIERMEGGFIFELIDGGFCILAERTMLVLGEELVKSKFTRLLKKSNEEFLEEIKFAQEQHFERLQDEADEEGEGFISVE